MRMPKKISIYNNIADKLSDRLPFKRLSAICKKNLPNYMFESKDLCSCTACSRTFSLKTLDKHKTERRCPVCHKPVSVQRNCGANGLYDHSFVMYGEPCGDFLVLRFFMLGRTIINKKNGDFVEHEQFTEVAREILGYKVDVRAEYESGEWNVLNDGQYSGRYFSVSRDFFHWYPNAFSLNECYADKKNIKSLLSRYVNPIAFRKCEDFMIEYTKENNKHSSYVPYDFKKCDSVKDFYREVFKNSVVSNYYDVVEKFLSAELYNFITDRDATYLKGKKDDSIFTLLKLNRAEYKWFLTTDRSTLTHYNYLQFRKKGLSLPLIERLYRSGISLYEYNKLVDTGNLVKKLNYFEKQNITCSEYSHYVYLLEQINAPLDNMHLYPKDFRKSEMELAEELEMIEFMRECKLRQKDTKGIRKVATSIYKAMKNSEVIKDLMKNSKGLIVKVPESAEELISEGAKMNNCLRTYCGQVASGKSQIFFIRRIEDIDKPFYAMEVRDGEIKQLYTYGNKKDEYYTEVHTFCMDFVKALVTATSELKKKKRRSTVSRQVA